VLAVIGSLIWGGGERHQLIERGGGALALCSCHFKISYNNQMKDGVPMRVDVGEDAQPRRNVWGGVVSLLRAAN
jgi:hypothetical protein